MNLNKVLLIGNLTKDPELRQTQGGALVCSFGIATNRTYMDGNGQKQNQAEFHNVVAWSGAAEAIAQWMKKGSLIMIEGRLQTRTWDDRRTGERKYMTEIVVESFQFGPKREAAPDRTADADFEGEIDTLARPVDDRTPARRAAERGEIATTSRRPRKATPPPAQETDGLPIELPEEQEIDVKDIPF